MIVNEVSIDRAIEKVQNESVSSSERLELYKTEEESSSEQELLTLQIKDDEGDYQNVEELLKESPYVSLCERHKRLVESDYERYGANVGQSGSNPVKKMMRTLGRMVSFRQNGLYQVNSSSSGHVGAAPTHKYAGTTSSTSSAPMKKNVFCNDQSLTEYNYFQGKQYPPLSTQTINHFNNHATSHNNKPFMDILMLCHFLWSKHSSHYQDMTLQSLKIELLLILL